LAGVTVSAKCKGIGKRKAKTNDSGYYKLDDLEDGAWKLMVKVKNYKEKKATIVISGGGEHEINFK